MTPPSPQYAYSTAAKPSIDAAFESHLSTFIGSHKQVHKCVDIYFATVHLWFPVVTEATYRGDRSFQSSAEQNLLTLCMALINTMPKGKHITEEVGPLYTAVKSSIAILESIDVQSTRLVQSRLLLSLFEVGHGLHNAAYVSLGAVARAASLIGINRAKANSEELNVWWGIVILDR